MAGGSPKRTIIIIVKAGDIVVIVIFLIIMILIFMVNMVCCFIVSVLCSPLLDGGNDSKRDCGGNNYKVHHHVRVSRFEWVPLMPNCDWMLKRTSPLYTMVMTHCTQ